MSRLKPLKLLVLPLILCLCYGVPETVVVAQSQCSLNNRWRTPGECLHFRQCDYQKGRFRVGSEVTTCPGLKGVVCCPTRESVSERYCAKWMEMLYAPISFDQERLSEPRCAVSQHASYIVGGREAYPFEYPHSVALGFGTNKDKLKYLCGATLISPTFLLTAAHCIRPTSKPTYAMIGDITINTPGGAKGSPYRKLVPIAEHIVHPDYRPPSIYNDIALLRLSTPLDLDRYVLPACLGHPITAVKKNKQVEASGWGITDATSSRTSNVLRSVNISVIDSGTCNEIYGLEPDKPYRYPNGIIKSQICATGDEKDTCRGDSGGGLYTRENNCLFHVVGVTSIGSKVCGLGSPAVYTNVASYQDWIEDIVWPNES